MRILVADDSKTNLALISASLIGLGHEVISANNGADAVSLFKKEHPDLIILDVVMEGMDGFECARNIRALCTTDWIPIIFLSASVDDASIAKGIEAGGDDYLTKPYSEITLAAKIYAMQRIAEMRKKLCDTTVKLNILSSTDPLTDVCNRLQFQRILSEKISEIEKEEKNLLLLFIDIDHFKIINDSLGHHVGDLLLKETAGRLKACLNENDFIARMGGDEFVILMSDVESSLNGEEVAQKIIESLAASYNLETHTVRITASIGIAMYPSPGVTVESLVKSADIAMYHAKASGRNNYQLYSQKLNEKYQQQINLEQELKFALDRNEMFMTYQPIFELLTRKVVGMEALARWTHPKFGNVSPNIFIPIAEETGLIVELGDWVLRSVCQQGSQWYREGFENIKISVNISLHQFLQDEFYNHVIEILNETQMPPHLLEFEITETTIITYTNQLKKTIHDLHELGISISIDDFGTKYSSLTSLKQLPISTLKIDKFFLKDVTTDVKNTVIVNSLIALGKSLDIGVIAEGIQTEEQVQFLIVNGCTCGQGFLLSKSLMPNQIVTLLKNQEKKEVV